MDAYLRGLLSKKIDTLLSENTLSEISNNLDVLKSVYSREQDAMFGYIIGEITTTFFYAYQNFYDRKPKESEVQEFRNLLLNNSNRIRSRINLFLNK